jgi:hypothetical protein
MTARNRLSITPGREYVVAGYDWKYYRIVDDRGEPLLYRKRFFDVVDPYEDPRWVKDGPFEDGVYYVDAPGCAEPGFYEDWHDRVPEARSTFARVFAELVADDERRGVGC